jgi:hypothetical protein
LFQVLKDYENGLGVVGEFFPHTAKNQGLENHL